MNIKWVIGSIVITLIVFAIAESKPKAAQADMTPAQATAILEELSGAVCHQLAGTRIANMTPNDLDTLRACRRAGF
jgi:hypothetical protein